MNKLKKLFSPSSLAATVATGMLVFGTMKALASYETSACRSGGVIYPCPPTNCANPCHDSTGRYWWCCASYESCGSYDPNCGGLYGCGWCL